MSLWLLLRTAFLGLLRHKLRSFLTMLGIIVGISAIMVTFSIGYGAQKRVAEQIMSMGENSVFIVPGSLSESMGRHHDIRLKEHAVDALRAQAETIKLISRGHDSTQKVDYRDKTTKDQVFGVDPTFLEITKRSLRAGDNFTERDVHERAQVVVLGDEIAKRLFGKQHPIGATIRIGKRPFTVIGVLNHIKVFWGTVDPNKNLFVPFSVAKKYFSADNESIFDLNFIALSMRNAADHDRLIREVKRIIRQDRRIQPGKEDDFSLFDQESISSSAQAAAAIIKLFGLIAASISLIVGGIGVMNIMLVSIAERTREIGIRLALGATPHLIQLQFLSEAVMLSVVGGFFGVMFGVLLQLVLSMLTNLPGSITFEQVMLAFIITVLIGLFFGYYPARSASKLHPVDALLDRK